MRVENVLCALANAAETRRNGRTFGHENLPSGMRLLVCVDRQKKGLHELFERRVNARGSSRRPGWRPWTPLQIYIVVLVSPTEILLLRVTRGYQAVLVESVAPAGFRQYGRFW